MSEKPQAGVPRETNESKYRKTVFLPQTDFPMKAGLPAAEPKWLERWEKLGLYERIREGAKSRGEKQFIFHDGPPYANGHAHIGTALNHILKDFVVRSRTMLGFDTAYVPGWDCHGLPIEWAVEQELRKAGKSKDSLPVKELRALCREFALKWIDIQRSEFKRLGCIGDWNHPYRTMDFRVEAAIVAELHKFLMNHMLYRGSKPVMWSVVEKTALAEAEIEYAEVNSTTIYVKFPVVGGEPIPKEKSGAFIKSYREGIDWVREEGLLDAYVVIWTTTPWTIPGNRAIAYSEDLADHQGYALYEVVEAKDGSLSKVGDKLILATALAQQTAEHAKAELRFIKAADPTGLICAHPFKGDGDRYDFEVRLLPGEHVTADAGTGFVHTAPSHGQEDFDLVRDYNARHTSAPSLQIEIPFTVAEDGTYTEKTGFLAGKRVLTPEGKEGDANGAVISRARASRVPPRQGQLRHHIRIPGGPKRR